MKSILYIDNVFIYYSCTVDTLTITCQTSSENVFVRTDKNSIFTKTPSNELNSFTKWQRLNPLFMHCWHPVNHLSIICQKSLENLFFSFHIELLLKLKVFLYIPYITIFDKRSSLKSNSLLCAFQVEKNFGDVLPLFGTLCLWLPWND